MLMLLALLSPAGDDSVWINEGIRTAISEHLPSYSVPAGTYSLANPIIVPQGTRNFALKGAGSGLTVLTVTDPNMTQAIQVGVQPVLSDNWMITGPSNLPALPVASGAGCVRLQTATPTLPLGYYVLWDDYRVVCAKGPNSVMNHAEIVKAVSYDPTTGAVKVDTPIGRDYSSNVRLCPFDAPMCANIQVSGFGFQGSTSDGLLSVGVCDGATVTDMSVVGFRSDAIMTNTARNVLIDNVRVSLASDNDAGSGYGVSIYRSRFVTIEDSTATLCRHGFLMHSGSMDVTVANCTTTNGFDLHGFDERRVSIIGCSGDGGDIGNDAWLAGAQGVLIRGCQFSEQFGFHANVKNVRISDTTLGGIGVYSAEPGTTPTVGVPAGGMADGLLFERSTIAGTGYTLFWENGATRMGTVTFNGCSFLNTSPAWGTCFDVGMISGTVLLNGCNLSVASSDHVVQIDNPGVGYSFQMQNCALSGYGGLGVWIKSIFMGAASFTDNSYLGVGYPPVFLWDDSHRATSQGNTVANR